MVADSVAGVEFGGCDRSVPRSRLHARFAGGSRLIVVRAPAGYGKTAAIDQWLGCRCCTVEDLVWIPRPAPGADGETYIEAVRSVMPCAECTDGGDTVRRRVRHASPPTQVLVLDRMDLVSGVNDAQMVADLLAECPHRKIIVTGCGDRWLEGLAVLVPDHDLVTVEDLTFTVEDAEILAAAGHVWLGPGELERVHRYTHGLPALEQAVFGAVRSLSRGPNRPARFGRAVQHTLKRYAQVRVLSDPRGPGAADGTLLRLALARELTPAAVTFLTGVDDPERLLEQLDTAGVLTWHTESVDACRELVPAVRDGLLMLARDTGVDTAAEQSALARFHLGRGEEITALALAADSGDWNLAVDLVEKCWVEMIADHFGLLRRVLERLPDEVLVDRPAIKAGRDMFTYSGGHLPESPTVLSRSPEELAALGASPQGEQALAVGAVQSMMLRVAGEIGDAAEYTRRLTPLAQAAAAAWPERIAPQLALMRLQWAITYQLAGAVDESLVELHKAYLDAVGNGVEFVARNAAGSTALNWALVGDTVQAQRWIGIESRHVEPIGTWLESKVRVAGLLARALVAIDHLDLAGAGRYLDELGDVADDEELWPFAAYTHARYALLAGDPRAGLLDLHRQIAIHRATFRGGVAVPLLTAAEVMLRLASGEGNLALSMAEEADQDDPWIVVAVAFTRLLTGDRVGAVAAARRVDWSGRSRPGTHMMCSVIEMVACLGHDNAAVEAAWRTARHIARQTGLIAPLAVFPREMLSRLEVFGPDPLFDRLRDAGQAERFPTEVPVVNLTAREQAVLEQLGLGRTAQQAADALFVSVNTVKSQLRSLYRKLGANSRDEALVVARRIGLLTPLGGAAAPRRRR